MISSHGIIRRAVLSDRFYPLSFWKDILGVSLTPVLDFKEYIDKDALMVYRWMVGKQVSDPLNSNPYYHGMKMYSTIYYPKLDTYGEEMYKGMRVEFYKDYYLGKPNMEKEILHHNFCLLSLNHEHNDNKPE